MTISLFFVLGLMAFQSAPDSTRSIDLEYCYRQIEENYPTADKIVLQRKITGINEKIARTGYYPDLTFSGMVSYQSDVTEVTFAPPGGSVPTFSKDHYKLALDVSQPIYDGGLTKARRSIEQSRGAQEVNSIEVQLHQLKEQVNQVYFSILLEQQRSRSVSVMMDNLRQQLSSVRSRVRNGVLLESQASVLEAELIKAEQDSIQIQADIAGTIEVLGILIGTEIERGIQFEIPAENPVTNFSGQYHRPEYQLFSTSQRLLENRMSLSSSKKLPKLSAFASTAYGRPGLNAFDDDLQAYYIVGLRLRWNFWDSFNANREQQAFRFEQEKIEADKQAFTRQLESSLTRLEEKMEALQKVIRRDEEIIRLSRQVVEESSSQLDQGVITATDYVQELNRLYQAQLNKGVHEIQLVQLKTDYKTKVGEPSE